MSGFIDKLGEYLFPGLIALAIVFALIGSARNRLTAKRLSERQQFDDDRFAQLFGDPARGDTAVRARAVLAKNLEMNLDGLRPQDRLDDDLRAEVSANPHLFWSLQEEFAIDCEVENLEVFEATTAKLVTFTDLVEYVHGKRTALETSGAGSERRTDGGKKLVDGTKIIAACWFSGIGLLIVSGMIESDGLMKFALALAFVPVFVGLLFVIVPALRDAARLFREEGASVLAQQPFSMAFWFVFMGILLCFAAGIAWLLLGLLLE